LHSGKEDSLNEENSRWTCLILFKGNGATKPNNGHNAETIWKKRGNSFSLYNSSCLAGLYDFKEEEHNDKRVMERTWPC
jgi:hypothetical protein